ncbi:uncharacterized protein C11orf98 homolog [Phaenicophaeus curvirostris]|uniref:uncharacterized protein C11orf98 homolog n=1 Tax=Phaenicophaeus curvirostris TaxID=33595 RepID=UPI0037F0C384
MGIGGKINRPRTELKKKLFKRRRVLARGGHKKKRRAQTEAPPPALWGKRRRKELKRLRVAARNAVGAGAAPEPPPSRDVEMLEEPQGTRGPQCSQ